MRVLPTLEDLSNIALFQELETKQLTWLKDRLRLQQYPAGYNIAFAEQPGETVYIILTGTLKVSIEQLDGTEVILAILGPGDTVGEMSLLDSIGRSANVVTMEKASLLWMDRTTFWECLRQMPTMTYELVQVVCERLRLANEQIQALATLDIYGRVARQLLAMSERYGQPTNAGGSLIPIRLTQSDIAGMVGASRERVNQVIVSYKQQNYISIDNRYRVTILNQEALAERCR